MPFYNCIARQNLLSTAEKAALATGITEIHCRLTGAPRHFVHVVFSHFDSVDVYSAGEPSSFSFIRAGLRAGRTQELKRKMLEELADLWIHVVKDADPATLMITFTETGPGNVLEGGLMLPHPDDDEQWKQRHGVN